MDFILIFLAAFAVCVCITFVIVYNMHLHFRQYYTYDYATFEDFQKAYDNYMKDHNLLVDVANARITGEMGRYTMLSLHLIKFEGEIMILKPWSYIRYCLWFNKQISIKNNRSAGLWN